MDLSRTMQVLPVVVLKMDLSRTITYVACVCVIKQSPSYFLFLISHNFRIYELSIDGNNHFRLLESKFRVTILNKGQN